MNVIGIIESLATALLIMWSLMCVLVTITNENISTRILSGLIVLVNVISIVAIWL